MTRHSPTSDTQRADPTPERRELSLSTRTVLGGHPKPRAVSGQFDGCVLIFVLPVFLSVSDGNEECADFFNQSVISLQCEMLKG